MEFDPVVASTFAIEPEFYRGRETIYGSAGGFWHALNAFSTTNLLALASFPFTGVFGTHSHLSYPIATWLEGYGPFGGTVGTCAVINGIRSYPVSNDAAF